MYIVHYIDDDYLHSAWSTQAAAEEEAQTLKDKDYSGVYIKFDKKVKKDNGFHYQQY